jgi:hypothetical protein
MRDPKYLTRCAHQKLSFRRRALLYQIQCKYMSLSHRNPGHGMKHRHVSRPQALRTVQARREVQEQNLASMHHCKLHRTHGVVVGYACKRPADSVHMQATQIQTRTVSVTQQRTQNTNAVCRRFCQLYVYRMLFNRYS